MQYPHIYSKHPKHSPLTYISPCTRRLSNQISHVIYAKVTFTNEMSQISAKQPPSRATSSATLVFWIRCWNFVERMMYYLRASATPFVEIGLWQRKIRTRIKCPITFILSYPAAAPGPVTVCGLGVPPTTQPATGIAGTAANCLYAVSINFQVGSVGTIP